MTFNNEGEQIILQVIWKFKAQNLGRNKMIKQH